LPISRRKGYAGCSMARKKNKKKPSLSQTVETLAKIAEEHLATMPEEEQRARLAALAGRTFTARRDKPSMPSERPRTRGYRALARGRQ
jgi:hypothetical protein